MVIPIIDLSRVNLDSLEEDPVEDPVLQQLHDALATVGFIFVTGHSIPQYKIERVFKEASTFFSLSPDCKSKYEWDVNSENLSGYIALQEERIAYDKSIPPDLKEGFNVTSPHDCPYPDTEVPSMRPAVEDLFKACSKLALTLLRLIGHALKLKKHFPEDPDIFLKTHTKMESATENFTTFRINHYPPLPSESLIQPDQARCREHVDFCCITLLFQDSTGGLEVKSADGEYVKVPYVSGAVLVILGELMQNWTSDIYRASPHRVLLPVKEEGKRSVRQSLVFFCHPDHEVLVECVDGSNKYPPVLAKEDTLQRLTKNYVYK